VIANAIPWLGPTSSLSSGHRASLVDPRGSTTRHAPGQGWRSYVHLRFCVEEETSLGAAGMLSRFIESVESGERAATPRPKTWPMSCAFTGWRWSGARVGGGQAAPAGRSRNEVVVPCDLSAPH
jgi:hypothetical protein